MRRRDQLFRISGMIYIIGALFGLIISLGGLFLLWSTKDDVTEQVNGTLSLLGRTLEATSSSIEVINGALDRASQNLALIGEIITDLGDTLGDTESLIDSTSSLVGNDLKGFVSQTQQSLIEVQESARMVDNALRIVDTTLQFLNRLRPGDPIYQPRTPLQESVAEVSRSLDPLPVSFDKIQDQLDVSAGHAATMQADVLALTQEIADIETNLEDARAVSKEYRLIIDDLQLRLNGFNQRLPLIFNVFYLGMTLFLVWILITQVGMLIHGAVLLGMRE